MLKKLARARIRGLLIAVGIVFSFMIVFAGVTNLDDLVLSGYLLTTDSISTNGNLRVAGTAAITGAVTQTGAATYSSKVNLDSSLVLGSTKYWNGGLYMNVQNKSGAAYRVGTIVQWDGTYITLMTTAAADTNCAAGLTVLAAEGTGYYSFMAADAGTNPATDTIFLTGTDVNGAVQYDTMALNGSVDSVWSVKVFKTVTTMTARSISGQDVIKACPMMGTTIAQIYADADTTAVRSYCGVVYPSTIADNAWGTILIQGMGKVLFTGLDGLANVGSPLDVDADSVGLASVYVGATGRQGQNMIGYAMMTIDGGGSLATAGAYGIRAVWAMVDFR